MEVRINKHEERRRAEARIQEDDPNADQREKECEDHVAHKDRSGPRGHLHRVHPRVEQKPVHRSGHASAVVQVHQQQHEVLVFEQLGKILGDHGPYAPYGMFDFEYRITLPQSKKILKAQDGEDKGEYKLTDLHLKYEIIESEDLVREVKDQYNVGRSLGYNYTTLLKTLSWKKDSTREVIDVNIPRKSTKAIVLLFTKSDAEDSENFPFAGLTKVNVTVEGNPNDVYSEGLAKRDMYGEARRFFGSRRKFYMDKFACVVDFRTVNDESVSGSGRRLIGTQAGVLLEIEKEATTTDLSCHVFVVADGIVNVVENKLQGVEY